MKKHISTFLLLLITFSIGFSQTLTPDQKRQLTQLMNEKSQNEQHYSGFEDNQDPQSREQKQHERGILEILGAGGKDSIRMENAIAEQQKLDSLRGIIDSLGIDSIFVSDKDLLNDSNQMKGWFLDSLVIVDSIYTDSLFKDSIVQDSISRKYAIYGLEVFKQSVKIESNLSDVPEEYKIVEGDKVFLQLSGSQNIERTYTVGKSGDLFFDLINKKVQVIGLSYRKLKLVVLSAMNKIGARGDVSIVAVHPYRIHFSGNVKNHGSELIPPYYPFWKVLLLSKGPSHYGSLRTIKVLRNNKVVANFDLYAFLESGEMPNITLQDEDVIYFGQRENVVEVSGFVKRDGVYEMKKGESFEKLIQWAAGLKSNSPVSSIVEIRRAIPLNKRVDPRSVYEYVAVNLTQDNSKLVMEDGDEVTATQIGSNTVNFVQLKGDGFTLPGKYALPKDPTTAYRFIESHGGLRPGFKMVGELVRDQDTSRVAQSVNLSDEAALKSIVLQGKDVLYAYHKNDDLDSTFNKISIKGYVREPIDVPYAEGLTLAAALRQGLGIKAGGLSEVYVKFMDEFKKVKYLKVDLKKDNPEDVLLQQNTEIFTFDTDKMDPRLPVVILAPNRDAIILDYSEDLNLDVIIKRLEGLSFDTDSNNVEINKPLFDSDNAFMTRVIKLSAGSLFNSALIEAGDVIIFRTDIKKEDAGYVILEGEFRTPGRYVLTSAQESIESVIMKAGGLRPRANIYSLQLFRKNGKEPIPVDADRDNDEVIFEQVWYLNNGDTVRIGKNNSTVEIKGSVLNPTKSSYRDDYDWDDYITYGAGGALDTADIEKSYVVYPNGKSQKLSLGFFSSPDIVPGSIIIVPEKPFIPPEAPQPQTQWGVILPGISAIITALGTIVTIIMMNSRD